MKRGNVGIVVLLVCIIMLQPLIVYAENDMAYGSIATDSDEHAQMYESELYRYTIEDDYDHLCSHVPVKPPPTWQVWLSKVGTPILLYVISVKRFVVRRCSALRRWVVRRVKRSDHK